MPCVCRSHPEPRREWNVPVSETEVYPAAVRPSSTALLRKGAPAPGTRHSSRPKTQFSRPPVYPRLPRREPRESARARSPTIGSRILPILGLPKESPPEPGQAAHVLLNVLRARHPWRIQQARKTALGLESQTLSYPLTWACSTRAESKSACQRRHV